jgi:MtfA peptidase
MEQPIPFFFLVIILAIVAIIYSQLSNSFIFYFPLYKFKEEWRNILRQNVDYYNRLPEEKKQKFERRIQHFLYKYKIRTHNTVLTDKDRILIAASGVIPVFGFNHWAYPMLSVIVLYPDDFEGAQGKVSFFMDYNFIKKTEELRVVMKLSRTALYNGFADPNDGENTGIHEFVHVMDLLDDKMNGIPDYLLERKYVAPWMYLMHREIQKIYTGESDIREYAAKSPGEFFAVVSEYFFERPQDLAREHPELYRYMNEIFKQRL